MIPIVLTATIVPNGVYTHQSDWRIRRQRYLDAITFYKQFSKVYLIENSAYDLAHDSAFETDDRCTLLKYPASDCPQRGKGYQEFQMLDAFMAHDLIEDACIKITGRYIYSNFGELFSALCAEGRQYDAVIDSFLTRRIALTSLFYVTKAVYHCHLEGRYRWMNDPGGVWAEHVIYAALKDMERVTFFPIVPVLTCKDTPRTMEGVKGTIKNVQRRLFSALNAKQLLR